jgi:hypothetical protein
MNNRRWLPEHLHRLECVIPSGFIANFLTVAVVPMLGYLYFQDEKNKIPTLQADTIKAGLSMGMILGQIGCELLYQG